jgi:transposase
MHLPALSAIRHNKRYKAVFARIVQKQGIKMKAAVAIQRKLLELSYILFKTQKPFDIKIFEQSVESNEVEIKKEVDEIQTTSFTV